MTTVCTFVPDQYETLCVPGPHASTCVVVPNHWKMICSDQPVTSYLTAQVPPPPPSLPQAPVRGRGAVAVEHYNNSTVLVEPYTPMTITQQLAQQAAECSKSQGLWQNQPAHQAGCYEPNGSLKFLAVTAKAP